MKSVMLAAGFGARLRYTTTKRPPEDLLRFDRKPLPKVHIEIPQRHGSDELVLGDGYHHQDIKRANIEALPGILMAEGDPGAAKSIEQHMDRGETQRLGIGSDL